MLTRAALVLMASCVVVALAVPAFAQSAPTGQNLQLRAVRIDVSQPSPGGAAAGAIPRHFANPQLLQEIKTTYASSKPQPSKPNRSPSPSASPTPVGSPAAVWTPGAAPTPAAMSTAFASLGELDGGGYEPPDTQVAAGLVNGTSELIEAVNVVAQVYPSGPSLNWGVCTKDSNIDSVSDPRVLFDAADGRWLIASITFAPASDAGWNLLVSSSSDPSTAQWYCLIIQTGGIHNPDGSVGNFPDFPKIGFNGKKIVMTGDAFSTIQRRFTTSYKFQGTEFVVINKSEVIGLANQVDVTMFNPPQGDFALEPAEQLATISASAPSSDPDVLYMASVNSAVSSTGTLDLWQIKGVPSSSPSVAATASVTSLAISTISTPPNAQQLNGGGVLIDTNDDSLLDAVFRDGSPGALWVSGNDACVPPGDTSTRSCARLIKVSIDPLLNPPFTIAQDFDVSAGRGTYLYYPAVRTDKSGNLVTVFSGSAASSAALSPGYPSVYTGVEKGVSNALTNFSLVWGGDTAYTANPPRWGDYSGAGTDPDDASVWIAGEYGTSFPFFGSFWGTAIAKVTP